jgi:TolB protein
MGLLALLTAMLLIFSIILGVRAGQRQLELQRRQEAAVALANAIDYHANGQFTDALDAYKRVLQLEPENAAAREGIQNVLNTMSTSNQPTVTLTTPTPTVTEPAPAITPSDGAAFLLAARTAFTAGRWQEAVGHLLTVKQIDATYASAEVETLLFDAYINLASERDNEDSLEEALVLFDKALELRPNTSAVRTERDLIAKYLDVLTYFGADWGKAIELLQELYAVEPAYRDVNERLLEALAAYSEALAAQGQWCEAEDQFTALLALKETVEVRTRRDDAQKFCIDGVASTGASTNTTATADSGLNGTPAVTRTANETATREPESTPTVNQAVAAVGTVAGRGHILYAARDITSGQMRILSQALGSNSPPQILQDEATHPALRNDGQRLVFRNLRNDMFGLGALDPGSGLLLRFTQFAEDSLPSWNPQANRLVFASNREGDRLWRVYVTWAETNGETSNLGLGEAPAWHPTQNKIVFRGCDATGNRCGLWTMSDSGSDRAPLTTVPADNRPTWSPNGRYIFFMSDGRDGNMEIYRADTTSDQIVRLTDSAAIDGLPTVSPDGKSVAFVSNRDGAWKVWVASVNGGAATPLLTINGDFGNWLEQDIQWVN